MYRYVLDEAEGVVVARAEAGGVSDEMATVSVRGIVALDNALCRLPFPRVTLVIWDEDAPHFGAAERDRVVAANKTTRHPSVRLLVARSGLHAATIDVMKQSLEKSGHTRWSSARTVDQAIALGASERPGLDRVVRRLLAVLDESSHGAASAIVKAAPPAASEPTGRVQHASRR